VEDLIRGEAEKGFAIYGQQSIFAVALLRSDNKAEKRRSTKSHEDTLTNFVPIRVVSWIVLPGQ